jgi:Zn-dependent peptidase ImmA (M78 family)
VEPGSLEVYHEGVRIMAKTNTQNATNGNGTKGDTSDVAYVTPALIAWALKRSRLSPMTIAQKLNVDPSLVEGWQKPNGPHPSFPLAQKLAKVLHVPFGFFYLSQPPSVDLPLPDFRGFDHTYKPSADLLELLNDILVKQDWFVDHQKDSGAPPLKFVGSFTTKDKVEDVADAIRARIGINVALRESASAWSDYLSILSRRSENAGILVMRSGVVANVSTRKLQANELLGFAVANTVAPIVFVNSADYKASQVFTLAHELAHLWIGESAIANPDELDETKRNTVEEFCNHVAAEVLVPKKDFLNEWKGITQSSEMKVQRMARRFWVSTYVTLRRARELGEVDQEQYNQIKKNEFARRKKDKSGGGDYYKNILARMGPRFTEAVLDDVNHGKLELRDAAGLLNMKVPTLVKFAEKHK